MCTREPQLDLVSLLIGWKSDARTLNQSLSELIINKSNLLITFDTQLKTTLLHSALVQSSRTTFSTNQKWNQNQSWLARTHFPALCDVKLLRALIGSLDYLHPFWLAKVITLVLILRYSIEIRSTEHLIHRALSVCTGESWPRSCVLRSERFYWSIFGFPPSHQSPAFDFL